LNSNYHGLGNETTALESKSHYEIEQRELSVRPSLRFALSEKMHLYGGSVFKGVETTVSTGSYLDLALVTGDDAADYTGDRFNQAGAFVGLTFNSRDRPSATTNGYYLDIQGSFYPAFMSLTEPLITLDAEAATYLSFSLPGDPVVALRAGGRRVWGRFPLHEAAFLGGVNTMQGFRRQRFAGDAALFGNAELRLFLSRFFVILPGEFGCFFSGDGGRVYLEGNTSDTWHTSLGGGVWFAFLERVNTFRLGFSRSREDTRFYIQGGFMF